MSYFTLNRLAPFLAACGLAVLAAGAARADGVSAADRPVGEVTMSVGPVMKISAQGIPEPVARGSRIMPGDRLDTAEGGHVHIRFVDGALVSVRPGSRLWVEDYKFDPQHVSLSLVRFKLEYGVARAISGAAAEGAKDRFRLNTPLVAIGVRGTDFVVHAGEQTTSAAVNQGAIIMAPFGEGCRAQALGPCGSPAAQLLSADMGQLQMEFRAHFAQPEIKPLQGAVFTAGITDTGPTARTPDTHAPVSGGPIAGRSDSEGLVTTALAEGAVQAVIDGHPSGTVVPPPAEAPPALQWGRWSTDAAAAGDFSVTLDKASQGRNVTVGNDQFILYRNEANGPDLAPGLGSYNFNLGSSFAQYSAGGQIAAAAVQQGQLSIDFAARQFSTSLSVTSAQTGSVTVSGSGFVRSDGIFYDRSVAGQVIAGAGALDGKTAGYFFEKAVGAGTLSGITLWSHK
ncbi:MAG: FecR family protein [Ramlibacter sp.]